METEPAFDTRAPFTRDMMRANGLDPGILRHREYRQLIRAVWVHQDGYDDDARIRAALLVHPEGAIASHFSAARVLRLPVPDHLFEHVTVFTHKDRRWRPEVKCHVTKRPRRLLWIRGIPTTDPITTFIQLAGSLPLVDRVVLGDALVKAYKISPAKLVRACRESTDYYAGAALAAALYVRRGVDSPMETRLRMLLVLAGLPEPKVDVHIVDDNGVWLRRFDLSYPDVKLIVEYDGRQHAEDPKQWESDLDRREEFDDEGFRVLVVTARGIYVQPERTIERVRRQLEVRGWAGSLNVHDGWRQHFPS